MICEGREKQEGWMECGHKTSRFNFIVGGKKTPQAEDMHTRFMSFVSIRVSSPSGLLFFSGKSDYGKNI